MKRAWWAVKWWVTSPLRWEFLHHLGRVKARYGGQPPVRAVFRLYHPAFWVLWWQLMWMGRHSYRGKMLKWFVWCAGGFVEMLITQRVPGVEHGR